MIVQEEIPVPEILGHSCDGMMVIDEQRRVLAMNPAMERLRGAVENSYFAWRAGLTVSIGVAVFPEDGTTIESLLAAADQRLYEAKHLGCNRVIGIQSALK